MSPAPLLMSMLLAADPAEVPLWDGPAPATVGDAAKNRPTLTVFKPAAERANGTAVVVCPGGGYGFLAVDHEGKQVADWLTARGVTAFMLQYRIAAKDGRPAPLHPAPMLDVQRAIRYVRAKATDHGIDPKKVGVWGFSAGGHLASTAATHFDAGKPDAADPIDKEGCRPDFAVLAYPVISMQDGVTHGGSRRNLIGEKPDPELLEFYSNNLRVTKDTPPTFLFHTDEDRAVVPENSVLFYQALKRHKVPAELHIFEKGPHGVGLGSDPKWAKGAPAIAVWTERLEAWMKGRGLLEKK
jgi:acetyl esterase/lipase